MNIDWSESPEGYPIWITDDDNVIPAAWHREDVDRYVDQNGAYWHKYDSRITVHRKRDQEWSGTGLPPVGTVCECKCTARGKERDWFVAKVKYISKFTSVLDDFTVCELEGEFVAHPDTIQFRPILTPEQIAAEERDNAIQEMSESLPDWTAPEKICAILYDAGYRKQEQPK